MCCLQPSLISVNSSLMSSSLIYTGRCLALKASAFGSIISLK
jgi:hypothetical protein